MKFKKNAESFDELMGRVADATRIAENNDKALNSDEYNYLGECLLTGSLSRSNEAVNDFFRVYGGNDL